MLAFYMRYFWKYLSYLFHAKHRKGFGIHSPFVFYLVTMVIEEKLPYYRFVQIENLRTLLTKTKKKIRENRDGVENERRILDFVRESSISPSYDQLLFRLVNFFKPKNVVEIGDSVGITTLYLATSDTRRPTYTICESKELADFAHTTFGKIGLQNIIQLTGSVEEKLPAVLSKEKNVDFVYIGREVSVESIQKSLDMLSPSFTGKTVLLMSDIWKDDRKKLWKSVKKQVGGRVSIDMFHYGMLIFNEDLQCEDYNLLYFPPLFKK